MFGCIITIHIEVPENNDNNYYQVRLDPVYNTPEPVYFTLDPIYNTLDHDIQPNPPHYNVISTAYNTAPQYSTTDDAVNTVTTSQHSTITDSVVDTLSTPLYSTVNESAVDSPHSTIDDTHVSAVDTAPTPLYSTVVVKDGREVTVTVGSESSTDDQY